jgi:hypothetical protein
MIVKNAPRCFGSSADPERHQVPKSVATSTQDFIYPARELDTTIQLSEKRGCHSQAVRVNVM